MNLNLSHRLLTLIFATAIGLASSHICVAAGNARQRAINGPHWLAVDSKGDLFIDEEYGKRILRLDRNKETLTVIAGNGHECCREENVSARTSSVYHVSSLAVDADDNLYIGGKNADDGAFVRVIHSGTGTIETLARGHFPASAVGVRTLEANLSDPHGIVVTGEGKLLVSADESHVVAELGQLTRLVAGTIGQKGFSGDGGPATSATFNLPGALAVDTHGNVFIADYYNHRIRRVDAQSGVVTTVAGNGSAISSGDGGLATAAGVPYPYALAADSGGNIFIVEDGGFTVRRVDSASGTIATIAGTGHFGFSGDGGPATRAEMSPSGLAVDRTGNLYISDRDHNRVRFVDAKTGIISTVAGNGLPRRKRVFE